MRIFISVDMEGVAGDVLWLRWGMRVLPAVAGSKNTVRTDERVRP